MPTQQKSKRRASRKTLETINDGLEEIAAYFGWERPSTISATDAVEEPPASNQKVETEDVHAVEVDEDGEGEEEDDEDEDDEFYEESDSGDGWFEKEEVEVAVDAFISALLSAGLIRKSRSGKLPSFEDVFERFFDEDDEIVELAQSFEENIEGYFDWISREDMDAARDCFLDIRDILQKRIGG
jgi:hypothetical protein